LNGTKKRTRPRDRFPDAVLIFENPTIEAVDDRADYGEVRHIALGLSGDKVLNVVYRGMGTLFVSSAQGGLTGMTQRSTTVRHSLRAIKRKLSGGASRSRADAPEAAPVGDDFWKRSRIVMPPGKTSVHLRVDSDVFDWFKKQGDGHLTRMNAVLRSYVEAHKD
jgi:uncharacterized protein (DUF4415 family)